MDASFSRAALLKFLDMLGQQGLANPNTAQSLRVACGKILVDLSDAEDADVRKVDVGLAVRKFNNKNPGKLTRSSLAEYQRRANLAIREFESYQGNPAGYRGIGRGPTKADAGEKPAGKKKDLRQREPSRGEVVMAAPPAGPAGASGLTFAFPLRQDFLAQLVVPRDMKADEAQRLCAFVRTLAIDFSPER